MQTKQTPSSPNFSTSKPNNDVITPELVEAFRRGDHMAYNRIYLYYVSQIIRFLTSLTKSVDEAEEIAQGIFVTLWEKRSQVDPSKSFNGYIYRLARNAFLNYCKARYVRKNESLDVVADTSDMLSGEDVIVAKEIELVIDLTILRMPEQRRRIFEMSKKEGLSNDQIAEMLSIKKESVEKQISAGRNDIRNAIKFLLVFLISIS